MAMKESGIEWVGLIPDTWSVIPNKYVMHKEKNLCEKWTGEDVMSLTMNGVIVRDLQNPTGKMPATFDGYQYIEDGDLLMCLFDIDVTPRCVGRVTHDGVTSPAYSNFKVHDNASRDYFYYYYLMVDNTKELLYLAKNLRHSFTEEQLGQLKVPMPPLSEQQAIADYLDETCSKIDEIIAEAKASIDEYKNLREAVISNATTRGIKKNRCMKSSGVEWVLEIPSDWDMIPAKVLFSQSNERKHVDDVQLTASQKYGIISQVEYMKRENSRIVIATQGIENWKHVEPNDFIISLRSFQGGLEKSDVSGCITWHYVVLKANNGVYYNYFKWLFKSDKYINALQGTCNFIRDGQDLRFSNFVQVSLLAVPIEEQKEIADYLNKKVPKIDSLISEKESLINDLEAYKKSLIFEVVTGKRKVV